MLATEKISKAFLAIIEEAEHLKSEQSAEKLYAGLRTIVSIAKHQSDIRGLSDAKCPPGHVDTTDDPGST